MRTAGLCFGLLIASCCRADNVWVVTSSAASGTGSLAAVIGQMLPNNGLQTIQFQLGANATILLNQPLPVMVGQSIFVDGSASPGLTLNGGGWPMFQVSSGNTSQTIRFSQLKLREGSNANGGGCINVISQGALLVNDVSFESCANSGPPASGAGGGAIRTNGGLRLTRTRFVGNSSSDAGVPNLVNAGGAVSVNQGGTVIIERSAFIGNRTLATPNGSSCRGGSGGAVALSVPSGAGATLTEVQFINNSSGCISGGSRQAGQAGALRLFGSGGGASVTLDRVYFGQNEAFEGGAIFAEGLRLNLVNTTFFENTAFSSGALATLTRVGGAQMSLSIRNSTFSRNSSSFGSSGASLNAAATTIVDVRNTVFAPSVSGPNCSPVTPTTQAGAAIFTSDNSCLFFLPGGTESLSTQFFNNNFGLGGATQSYGFVPTLNIAAGSPLIDNGSSTQCPSADARGISRPRNGGLGAFCDVGAVEYSTDLLFGTGFEFGQ